MGKGITATLKIVRNTIAANIFSFSRALHVVCIKNQYFLNSYENGGKDLLLRIYFSGKDLLLKFPSVMLMLSCIYKYTMRTAHNVLNIH